MIATLVSSGELPREVSGERGSKTFESVQMTAANAWRRTAWQRQQLAPSSSSCLLSTHQPPFLSLPPPAAVAVSREKIRWGPVADETDDLSPHSAISSLWQSNARLTAKKFHLLSVPPDFFPGRVQPGNRGSMLSSSSFLFFLSLLSQKSPQLQFTS